MRRKIITIILSIIAALFVVLVAFLILNFNSIWNTVTFDANSNIKKYEEKKSEWANEPNRIEIPSLGVIGKLFYPKTDKELEKGLKNGIAHVPSTNIPGEDGNVVYTAHSSALTTGYYRQIFATLPKISQGAEIYVYKDGQKYTYTVTEKRVIAKTEVSVLKDHDENTLSLITCWPLGTDWKRYLVVAKEKEI